MKKKILVFIVLAFILLPFIVKADGFVMTPEEISFNRTVVYSQWFIALTLNLLVELLVAYIYSKAFRKLSGRVYFSIIIANISFLFLILAGILFKSLDTPILIGAEIFIILFEGCFIFILNKKEITLKQSLILSLIMNIASLLIVTTALLLGSGILRKFVGLFYK